MKKYFLVIVFSLFCLPFVVQAQSEGIIISPHIIDEKVLANDLLKYDIKIKNNSSAKANLYAMVNDMSESDGEMEFIDPSSLDKDTSVARWIKFKRGVIELMPGEEIIVPLEINISSTAIVGKRFARIALPNGSNRSIAGSNMSNKSYAQLNINIEIEENIIEKAQVKNFSSKSRVYLTPPASFIVNLNNFGNQDIRPKGNIYIYDRRGKEVAKIDANAETELVSPGESWEQIINWDEATGFGKFKAKLEIEYGEKDKRDLQDTVFFWIFPWKILLAFFVGTFVFLVLMVTLIFKRTYRHSHAHPGAREQVAQEDNNGVLNLKK